MCWWAVGKNVPWTFNAFNQIFDLNSINLQVFCIFLFLVGSSLFATLLSQLNEIIQVRHWNEWSLSSKIRSLGCYIGFFAWASKPESCACLCVVCLPALWLACHRPLWNILFLVTLSLRWQAVNKETHDIDQHLEGYISFMTDFRYIKHLYSQKCEKWVETYCSRVPRKIEKQIREWVRFQFTEDQNEVKVCLFHLVLWAFSSMRKFDLLYRWTKNSWRSVFEPVHRKEWCFPIMHYPKNSDWH